MNDLIINLKENHIHKLVALLEYGNFRVEHGRLYLVFFDGF